MGTNVTPKPLLCGGRGEESGGTPQQLLIEYDCQFRKNVLCVRSTVLASDVADQLLRTKSSLEAVVATRSQDPRLLNLYFDQQMPLGNCSISGTGLGQRLV